MERESFSSSEVADILNKFFIPIKLDRESRPDLDDIYMNYVTATTGSGGWPLNLFLTPDLKPVFGGKDASADHFPADGSATRDAGRPSRSPMRHDPFPPFTPIPTNGSR